MQQDLDYSADDTSSFFAHWPNLFLRMFQSVSNGFCLFAAKVGTTRHVETRKQADKAEETREISLFPTKKTELI